MEGDMCINLQVISVPYATKHATYCEKQRIKQNPKNVILELDIQVTTRMDAVIMVIFRLYFRVILKPK